MSKEVNNMTITESMLRRAIMQRTDLSAANKLVLLAILLKISWETWSGPATVGELTNLAGLSERSIQTALKKLNGTLITRSYTKINGRSLPTIKLLTGSILKGCRSCGGADSAGCKICTSRGADPAVRGADLADKGEKSAPLQYIQLSTTNNTTIDQPLEGANEEVNFLDNQEQILNATNWGEIADQVQAEELRSKATIQKHLQLTADQKATIQKHVRFEGHAERVRVARKLLNIKLLKGGYYEPII